MAAVKRCNMILLVDTAPNSLEAPPARRNADQQLLFENLIPLGSFSSWAIDSLEPERL